MCEERPVTPERTEIAEPAIKAQPQWVGLLLRRIMMAIEAQDPVIRARFSHLRRVFAQEPEFLTWADAIEEYRDDNDQVLRVE